MKCFNKVNLYRKNKINESFLKWKIYWLIVNLGNEFII